MDRTATFSRGGGGAYTKSHPKTLVYSALLGVACAAIGTSASAAEKRLDVPFWRQPDGSTCMPTSLLMTLVYFGKDTLSNERIYELHRRTRVNRLNIPGILREYGLDGDASYSPYWTFNDIKADIDDGLPVILGTDISDSGHILVAVGYTDDDKVIVHDPGYRREGYTVTTLEELRFDGGGVRFRAVPRGPYQAEWVAHGRFPWVREGERRGWWVEYRNRGTEPWRAGDVVLRPTGDRPTAWYDAETWIDPKHVTVLGDDVPPGGTARFAFTVRAPRADAPLPVHQPFHLALRSDEWFSHPRDQDIGIDTRVWPTYVLPLGDAFPENGPQLRWVPRWREPQLVPRDDDPAGDGHVLRIQDTVNGGYDSIRIGNLEDGDYAVTAVVYCDYRPDNGEEFERVGLFARDNYRGDFEAQGKGRGYMMLFDSNTGRLWCVKCRNGNLTDFLSEPMHVRESGWHEFRISCRGRRIAYALDSRELVAVEDSYRSEGQAGIGHHEYFEDNAKARGALVAEFSMTASDPSR